MSRCLSLLLCVLLGQVLCKGAGPVPRLYCSTAATTGFRVIPDGAGCRGVLFTLNADGSDHVLWSKPLVVTPETVMILDPDAAHLAVVSLDATGASGGPHSVVVYDRTGTVTADLAGRDFLPVMALKGNLSNWRSQIAVALDQLQSRLVLTFRDGHQWWIELPSGKLRQADQPWQPLFAGETWFRDQTGDEQIVSGKLEAIPETGMASTLMRTSLYRIENRTLYTGGKRLPALDALVGKQVEIKGKLVDMNLEGQELHELWPASIRATAPQTNDRQP